MLPTDDQHCHRFPGWSFYRQGGRTANFGANIALFGIALGGTSAFSTNLQVDTCAGNGTAEHDIVGHDGPPTTSGVIYSY